MKKKKKRKKIKNEKNKKKNCSTKPACQNCYRAMQ